MAKDGGRCLRTNDRRQLFSCGTSDVRDAPKTLEERAPTLRADTRNLV